MGFEPTTLRDLAGCSNHRATGTDSVVSKGEMWAFDRNRIARSHSKMMTGTYDSLLHHAVTLRNIKDFFRVYCYFSYPGFILYLLWRKSTAQSKTTCSDLFDFLLGLQGKYQLSITCTFSRSVPIRGRNS